MNFLLSFSVSRGYAHERLKARGLELVSISWYVRKNELEMCCSFMRISKDRNRMLIVAIASSILIELFAAHQSVQAKGATCRTTSNADYRSRTICFVPSEGKWGDRDEWSRSFGVFSCCFSCSIRIVELYSPSSNSIVVDANESLRFFSG